MKATRIRLLAGQSPGREWVASDAPAGARVDVGSSDNASWLVKALGVKGLHLQLYWDGNQLWVADLHNAGGVGLGGNLIRDWTALHDGSRITFGGAALQVSGPTAKELVRASSEPADVSRTSAPDESALKGIPTQVATEDTSAPHSTKLTSLSDVPNSSQDAAPTPPPIIGAGVERVSSPAREGARKSGAARFAPPPPDEELSSASGKKTGIPKRTLIMGGSLAVALLVVLLMPGADEPQSSNSDDVSSAQPPIQLEVHEPQIRPRVPVAVSPEELDDGALTPSRQAADALLAGRTWEAADRYAGLSVSEPSNSTYALVARLLERELRNRCQDDPDAHGDRCVH